MNVAGTDGDDTLNLANMDAIFAGMVAGDAGGGNDTLRLTSSGQLLDLTQIPDGDVQGLEIIDITGSGKNTLTLDLNEVVNLSSTTDTLRVQHDVGDVVNYGAGWTVTLPQIVAGQFVHVLVENVPVPNDTKIEVVNTLPFRNPLRSLDTNRDGTVAPLDALIIVNRLNGSGPGLLQTPISVAGLTEFFYIDTNGDGSVAPSDVIQVINFLNSPADTEGEGVLEIIAGLPVLPALRSSDSSDVAATTPATDAHHALEPGRNEKLFGTSALPSNATPDPSHNRALIRTKTNTKNAADEDLVQALDTFFAELQAS